jgi:diguanylate cyclase (GGDEF)-like protein
MLQRLEKYRLLGWLSVVLVVGFLATSVAAYIVSRGAVRDNDIVARWGGEEFLILLRDVPLDVACKLAENLRQAIEEHDFRLAGLDAPVTASMGMAEYAAQETQAGFLRRIDKALYGAKKAGRNRIHVSTAQHAEDSVAWSLAD